MRIEQNTAIRISFTIALLILCGISIFSYRRTQTLIRTESRVSGAREVLDKLDVLLTQVLEVESASRGYSMAGKDFYLEPYYSAVEKVEKTKRELQSSSDRSPTLQKNLPLLDALVDEKVANTTRMIELRRNQGIESAQQLFVTGRGHEMMDGIRDRVYSMKSEEEALLQGAEADAKRAAGRSTYTLIGGSLLSIAILLLVYHYLNREIAERKRAIEALRESEERFRQMAENIEEMFWLTNADRSQMLYVSPTYSKLWGRSCESLYANPKSYLDAIHPDERERVIRAIAQGAQGGAWNQEYRIVRPDGSIRWVWDRSFEVRDQTGRFYRFVGITQDITGRKQAEEEIIKLNADLEHRVDARTAELAQVNKELALRNEEVERANHMKSEFLARMSHELRTPLNAIIGFSDLLAESENLQSDAKQARFLEHIRTGAHHLLQLINDILDVSKIEAGRMEVCREEFSAASATAEVLSLIRPMATSKNILIECGEEPGLVISADRIRFKQILYNLLSNAVKFTPLGGRIRIESSREDGFVLVSVSDTGIGISREDQESIFEEFHRVSGQSQHRTEGSGLGLAITRRLVELLGGRIWVESEPAKGSRFAFTLPDLKGSGTDLEPISADQGASVRRSVGE